MTVSILRPAILVALALAALSGCGGKASFEISGVIQGQLYPGLVIKDEVSGQSLTFNEPVPSKTFAFPNSIEYGTLYDVKVVTNPAHQDCATVNGGSDTAGRMSSINAVIFCRLTEHTVGGSIKLAPGTTGSYVGLKLINGSNDLGPITITDPTTAAYSYSRITYLMPYGITIFEQPTDKTINCQLVPKVPKAGDLKDKVSGVMGDADVVIDILCSKI